MNARAQGLVRLREEHDAYIRHVKAAGKPVLSFAAPCCGETIETPAPRQPGTVWDSLATCQHCGSLYMKVAHHDRVEGKRPGWLK